MGLKEIFNKKTSNAPNLSINDLSADQCVNIEENFKHGMSPTEISEDLGIPTELVYRYKRYRIDNGTTMQNKQPVEQDPNNGLKDQISKMRSQINEQNFLMAQITDLENEMQHKQRIRELEIEKREMELGNLQLDMDQRTLELEESRLSLKEQYGESAEGGLLGEMGQTLLEIYQKAQQNKKGTENASTNPTQSTLVDVSTPLQSDKSTGGNSVPPPSSLKTYTDTEIKDYIKQQPKLLVAAAKKMSEDKLFSELQGKMQGVSAATIKRTVEIIKSGEI